ncbi:MAG: hypothetical protein H0W33_04510 [Gammaproteobacteria bacterium]|nr:hypothetical protein [Gammaproteobacteria bacterium]
MKTAIVTVFVLAAAGLIGCATETTQDRRLGPTFSDEEKELMTDEEKLSIYNA